MEKCTVVVSSCDKNEDLWSPFFQLLNIQWNNRHYPIVLNTESKKFDYKDMNIKTFQFYKLGKKVTWSKRLLKTLKAIDTEYILFMLEDFFLSKPVDQQRIEQCINWMDNDKNISVFSFNKTIRPDIRDNKYLHFEKRSQTSDYRLNCQVAVWRREKLISYLRPHEDPWQFEILGSIRSQRYKEDFYSAIEGYPYVFTYDLYKHSVTCGKWRDKAIVDLFKEHDIKFDCEKRGFLAKEVPINLNLPVVKQNKNPPSLLKKKLKSSNLFIIKKLIIIFQKIKKAKKRLESPKVLYIEWLSLKK